MEGEFDVGYNHEYLLFKEGLQSATQIHLRNLVTKKTRRNIPDNLKVKSSGIFSFITDEKPEKVLKFHYPLVFTFGQMIGAYETAFDKKTHFIYRVTAK